MSEKMIDKITYDNKLIYRPLVFSAVFGVLLLVGASLHLPFQVSEALANGSMLPSIVALFSFQDEIKVKWYIRFPVGLVVGVLFFFGLPLLSSSLFGYNVAYPNNVITTIGYLFALFFSSGIAYLFVRCVLKETDFSVMGWGRLK